MVSEESYPFILLILAFIRVIGGIVFLDFYSKYKYNRFLILTVAFTLFSLNPALQLFTPPFGVINVDPTQYSWQIKLLFVMSEVIMTIGVYLFVIIFINYNTKLDKKIIGAGLILIPIIVIILYPFVTFEISFYLTQIIDLIIILSIIPYIIYNRKPFQEIAKNIPLFFLINIAIAIVNLVITFPFFNSELIGTLELLTRIGLSFIIPFTFIHLEYNLLALEKYDLKDKYSHNLAQILQSTSTRLYIMSTRKEASDEIKQELDHLQAGFTKIKELLTLIREI